MMDESPYGWILFTYLVVWQQLARLYEWMNEWSWISGSRVADVFFFSTSGEREKSNKKRISKGKKKQVKYWLFYSGFIWLFFSFFFYSFISTEIEANTRSQSRNGMQETVMDVKLRLGQRGGRWILFICIN